MPQGQRSPQSCRSNGSSSDIASYTIYLAVDDFSFKAKGSCWNRRHPSLNCEILSLFKTKEKPTRDGKQDNYQENYRGFTKTCRNVVRKSKSST